MYQTLKKQSLKAVLPRILVLAVLAAALLGISGGGLVRLAAGPKALEDIPVEELSGKYVTFDASRVIVAFANLTSKGDGSSTTLETYYLLPAGDGQYMAVMDARERHKTVLDRAMEQSHEYYMGNLETLTPLGPLSGTVGTLDEDMYSYMADCIDQYQLPGYEEGRDSQRLLAAYQVNLDRVGFLTKPVALGLGAAGLAALLLAVAQLLVAVCGGYQRTLKKALGQDPDPGFSQAAPIERTRVGKYIWFSKGPGSRAVLTEQIIWGYAMPEPMVVSKYRWPVALYDLDQRLIRIQFMEQKHCQDFLKAIAAQGHPFHMGYTSAAAELFQTDPAAFVRKARQEAAQPETE